MPSPQQTKGKGRRSGGQQGGSRWKYDGPSGTATPGGPGLAQGIGGKEPKTPSKTEGRAKDNARAHGRNSLSDSIGDGYEEGAASSRSTTHVAWPPANNLKEEVTVSSFHLDEDLLQAIRDSTPQQGGDTQMLLAKVHERRPAIQDYQFLLEAMSCEILGQLDLRDTCIQLYLLVRRYSHSSLQSMDHFYKLSDEYLNKSSEEIEQLANRLQRMTLPQTLGEEGDEISWSVSQTENPYRIQSPRKGNSKSARQQSSIEAKQNRPTNLKNKVLENYRRRDSKWFTIGRVFTMLWHDNATAGKRRADDTGSITRGPYRQSIYSQIRRFAVVKRGHGFSWAIPINTYHLQGTTRPSFDEQDRQAHAIIYMEGTEPKLLPGEEPLIKTAIAVVGGAEEDRKLEEASRIRFDKVFTIEHNVLVRNVGKISDKSMPYFRQYWREQLRGDGDAEVAR